jgi:hypothetical protein
MIKIKNKTKEESYRTIFKDIMLDIFITDEDRRKRGDHLGIFLYVALWFFGVLLFSFSTNYYIINAMIFYLFYDIVAISFIIFFFFNEKHLINKGEVERGVRFLTFPTIKDIIMMIIFVLIVFSLVVLINCLIEPFFLRLILHEDILVSIFEIMRIVPVEEIAFRGMGFFITIMTLSYMFNPEGNKLIMKKKNKTKYEIVEKRIWFFTIFFIGIIFGLFHFFKFYSPETFPYITLNIYGEITRVHIIYPLFYLCSLGIVLGICRLKYGLAGAMLCHFINNIMADAVLYAIIHCYGGVIFT